jgi:nitroreductase
METQLEINETITGLKITEIIRRRHSCRNYSDEKINDEIFVQVEDYCKQFNKGLFDENVQFQLIHRLKSGLSLDYGIIQNHHNYIIGMIKNAPFAKISYGYLLEQIVLKLTGYGLATCWVGYFDSGFFNDFDLNDGEYILPAIVVTGYSSDKLSFIDKLTRLSSNSSKRQSWETLFYYNNFQIPLTPEIAGKYAESIEMLRLSPSSGNTQPWRVVKERDKNVFHFYKKIISTKYEKKGLHDIDMGICMSHFELTSKENGFSGKWERSDPKIPGLPEKTEYVITWHGNIG